MEKELKSKFCICIIVFGVKLPCFWTSKGEGLGEGRIRKYENKQKTETRVLGLLTLVGWLVLQVCQLHKGGPHDPIHTSYLSVIINSTFFILKIFWFE